MNNTLIIQLILGRLRPYTRRRAYLGRVLSIAEYSGTGGSSLIGSLNSAKPLIAKQFTLAAHPGQSDRLGQLLTDKLTAADRCAGEPSGESCKAFTY